MSEFSDFRQYCETLTVAQLRSVIEKETEASAGGSEFRAACAEIARAVLSSRER